MSASLTSSSSAVLNAPLAGGSATLLSSLPPQVEDKLEVGDELCDMLLLKAAKRGITNLEKGNPPSF